MEEKKCGVIHYIFWDKMNIVLGGLNGVHYKFGWKTACRSFFWKSWRGTTEKGGVTCKRCLTKNAR